MYDDRQRRQRIAELEGKFAPREAIRQLLLAFASHTSNKSGNRGCFLTNTALELAAHDLEAGRIVAKAQKEIEEFFLRMIRKGQATGEIPSHVNPEGTASGLLAALIGLAVLSRSRPERALLQAIVADADRRLG
jgi:TetR/AcrR family transcriptional repressor of nem operon